MRHRSRKKTAANLRRHAKRRPIKRRPVRRTKSGTKVQFSKKEGQFEAGGWIIQTTAAADKGHTTHEDVYNAQPGDSKTVGVPAWLKEVLTKDRWPKPFRRVRHIDTRVL